MIGPERMRRVLRRLEDYPEFRDILFTPQHSDIPVEHRYVAVIETLLNKLERVQADLMHLQHPTTPKVTHGESYEATPGQAEGPSPAGQGQAG